MAFTFKFIYISVFFILISNQVLVSNVYSKSKFIEVLSDLPSHKELPVYIASLKRVIAFCLRNTKYLDTNLAFGLFLINVNLKPFVKNDAVPILMQNRLNQLIMLSEDLRDFYDYKMVKDKSPDKIISLLFTNDTAWSKRIGRFHLNLLKKTSYGKSAKTDRMFWAYQKEVDNLHGAMPTAQQSDMCMVSLSESEENLTDYPYNCKLLSECYKSLIFGTNLGYALTHRLLLLLLARLSRKCAIFTPSIDDHIRIKFCERAYMEAEYNAVNGFKIPDLMFEQMTLCSLDGHAQFLRKSWISNLLRIQNPSGCFNEALPSKKSLSAMLESRMDMKCNGHVTAVAAGTLAGAVRFIMEKYGPLPASFHN